MKKAKKIDVEFVKSVLRYDPETGKFFWIDNFHKSRIGTEAGYRRKDGYVVIKIQGSLHGAGRIAFVLSGIDISEDDEVDHINRNPSDNRFINLRVVTPSGNCNNRATILGESFPRYYTKHRTGKIQVVVKGKYLGLFKDTSSAKEVISEYLK